MDTFYTDMETYGAAASAPAPEEEEYSTTDDEGGPFLEARENNMFGPKAFMLGAGASSLLSSIVGEVPGALLSASSTIGTCVGFLATMDSVSVPLANIEKQQKEMKKDMAVMKKEILAAIKGPQQRTTPAAAPMALVVQLAEAQPGAPEEHPGNRAFV